MTGVQTCALPIYIILDDKHPIFNSTIENIIVPNDHPLDINGKVPVNTDKNYAEVGMALIRLCYSQEKQDKEHLIWAYPIEKEFSAYPLYNEVVGVIQYFDNDTTTPTDGWQSLGTFTYNTTPSGSWFGWSFPNAGDGSTYLVNDTTNQRFYRVTLMIGPGYTKNFISIERLH